MGRHRLPEHVAMERERLRQEDRKLERTYAPESLGFMCDTPQPIPPDFVLAERDRRLSAPMTLTMLLTGDPPVGFSALDRLRAA